MILQNDGSFFIEHHSRRKGVYNSRIRVDDNGRRDMTRSAMYRAEMKAHKMSASSLHCNRSLLRKYLTVAVIDQIVSQDQYVEWFGGTSLLVRFSQRREQSRAWAGYIEFCERPDVPLFDIYHELAHTVTLRDGEPSHGQRFAGAFALIASLSLFQSHATDLVRCMKENNLRFPYGKFFSEAMSNNILEE